MALVIAILLALFVLPSPWGLVAVVVGGVVEVAETAVGIRWSRRRRAQVGAETLRGTTVRVVVRCDPVGKVSVRGELWQARCETGAEVGETVRVTALEGLTLLVERVEPGVTPE